MGADVIVRVVQDKERLDMISRISLFCWLAGTSCTTLVEVRWLSDWFSMRRAE